ncbi:MAG: Hpt domain-containing protein [Gammaproteobacteria bacterium]|jgi:two-component system chemotaxis sensor kinase CheA|nr:Hpt domain-containing protein [Gammaproteobacteria bacterium]
MDSEINIDLSQFHDVFFEECSEGMEIMESGLLNLKEDSGSEVINTIFRAAHSIKGGGGTFGFSEISDFTHGMETILDEMRNGKLSVTPEVVALLLAALDCLREMVQCSKDKQPIDQESVSELHQKLEDFISNSATSATAVTAEEIIPSETEETEAVAVWNVSFYPNENMFYTGNDPFRLIRELQSLGELDVSVNHERLPAFSDMDVQSCYLGWDMVLRGNVSRDLITEIFEWVEDDCELDISQQEEVIEAAIETIKTRPVDEPKTGRRRTDKPAPSGQESASIRVGINKVDGLVNLVGELVITPSILSRLCNDLGMDNNEKLS